MEDAVLPETEEQQRLYHSVSVVGTLLLQVVAASLILLEPTFMVDLCRLERLGSGSVPKIPQSLRMLSLSLDLTACRVQNKLRMEQREPWALGGRARS